jgi:DNA-binding beta-propeller fold protein YncE
MTSQPGRLVLPLILSILFSPLFSVIAGSSSLLRPVALWPASGGGLYVLDKARGLTYIPGGAGLDLRNSSNFATFSASWQAVDMAAVRSGSDDRVYVLLAQETIGMLMCYSNRQFERSWISKTLLTGIAPDPAGHRLFLSGGLTNEIFVFDLNDPGASPTKVFIGVSHGSQLLGPLALDSDQHVLYAGDERTGVIFAINTDSKSVSQLTQIAAGQPSALAFESVHRVLYVADSVGRKVWALGVDKNAPKFRIFSRIPDFRQPSAIAVDANGTVWLGDEESQAIYQLAPNGAPTTYRLSF